MSFKENREIFKKLIGKAPKEEIKNKTNNISSSQPSAAVNAPEEKSILEKVRAGEMTAQEALDIWIPRLNLVIYNFCEARQRTKGKI